MFVDLISVTSGAVTLFQSRDTIWTSLKRFRRRVFRGTWRVPIFGGGGTGKTTLGTFLAGQLDLDIARGSYRETLEQEKFNLPGEIPCHFLVPPGQERRRHTWKDLYQVLSAGKAAGLINVVSWGHHATELELKDLEVWKPGITEKTCAANYLAVNRKKEIKAMEQLVPHLKAAKGKLWMITLVTKQDLWWPKRKTVDKHYRNGEYEACIQDIIAEKGRENFSHNYFSLSFPKILPRRTGSFWPKPRQVTTSRFA